MNLDTFLDHLDRYGPDLHRWPDEVRAPARTLLATSEQATTAMVDARRLASLLDALPDRPAAPYLASRIAARASAETDLGSRLGRWFGNTFWGPAIAAAIPLALGFVLGFSYQQPQEADDVILLETVAMLPFSRSFEELPYEE